MNAAGLCENEMVLVANVDNGERFETYVIKGKKDSGVIGLYGAAARLGQVGHRLIIMSMALLDDAELKNFTPSFVSVDEGNRVVAVRSGVCHG